MKKDLVLVLSVILLLAVFMSAKAHAVSKTHLLENLQGWQRTTQARQDLEPRERDLRTLFIQRLIFQTEHKYQETALKDFLRDTLLDMSEIDQLKMNRSYGSMSEFLESASMSVDQLLEQNESPLTLLKEFTEYSGISDPATMEEFSETRSYYNGKTSQGAHFVDIEGAALYLDEYEQKRNEKPSPKEEWFDFHNELREEFLFEAHSTTV